MSENEKLRLNRKHWEAEEQIAQWDKELAGHEEM